MPLFYCCYIILALIGHFARETPYKGATIVLRNKDHQPQLERTFDGLKGKLANNFFDSTRLCHT